MDGYLFRQLLVTILFGIILFAIIWLAPDTLFRLIQHVFSKELTIPQAALMFLYHIPAALPQAIPIAVILGSYFVFQRLSQQFELIAMFSSGISKKRVLQSLIWVGLVFSLLHFSIQELITPITNERLDRLYISYGIKEEIDRNFVFVEKNDDGDLNQFFLIGQAQKEQLNDFVLLVYEPMKVGGSRISKIFRSASGRWDQTMKRWEMYDGIELLVLATGILFIIAKVSSDLKCRLPFFK